MSAFDLVLGVLLILEGVVFVLFAESILEVMDLRSPGMRNFIAGVCVILGLGVALGSLVSNSPTLVMVLGIGILVAGPGYRLMPVALWDRTVAWWTETHLTFYRIFAVVSLTLLGGYLLVTGFS